MWDRLHRGWELHIPSPQNKLTSTLPVYTTKLCIIGVNFPAIVLLTFFPFGQPQEQVAIFANSGIYVFFDADAANPAPAQPHFDTIQAYLTTLSLAGGWLDKVPWSNWSRMGAGFASLSRLRSKAAWSGIFWLVVGGRSQIFLSFSMTSQLFSHISLTF